MFSIYRISVYATMDIKLNMNYRYFIIQKGNGRE